MAKAEGIKVLSLYVAQRHESPHCPALPHTLRSQAKNMTRIHTRYLITRNRGKLNDDWFKGMACEMLQHIPLRM